MSDKTKIAIVAIIATAFVMVCGFWAVASIVGTPTCLIHCPK